jgi:hypothetical protein
MGRSRLERFQTNVQPLLVAALRSGAPVPLTLEGPNDELPDFGIDWIVEAAWPEERVALVTDDAADRDEHLRKHDWKGLRFDDCASDTLAMALGLE